MNLIATVKAAADKTPTATVIEALIQMGDERLTEDQNIVRAALRSLIEDRHPEVDDLMNQWAALEWGIELGYTAALLAALKASSITA